MQIHLYQTIKSPNVHIIRYQRYGHTFPREHNILAFEIFGLTVQKVDSPDRKSEVTVKG